MLEGRLGARAPCPLVGRGPGSTRLSLFYRTLTEGSVTGENFGTGPYCMEL